MLSRFVCLPFRLNKRLLALIASCAVLFAACSSTDPTPTPTVEPTPPIVLLDIDASISSNAVAAASSVAITAGSGGSGLAQYTLTIDDHLRSIVRYDGQLVDEFSDGTFTLQAWNASAAQAEWSLRSNTPGSYTVTLFVSGEVGVTPTGPWFFTSGTASLSLTVN